MLGDNLAHVFFYYWVSFNVSCVAIFLLTIAFDESKKRFYRSGRAKKLRITINGRGRIKMDLKLSQKVLARVQALDGRGVSGATLDAAPVWSISDEGLLELGVFDDGMSALVKPRGLEGSVVVSVRAVSKGKELVDQVTINLVANSAESIKLVLDEPEDL